MLIIALIGCLLVFGLGCLFLVPPITYAWYLWSDYWGDLIDNRKRR